MDLIKEITSKVYEILLIEKTSFSFLKHLKKGALSRDLGIPEEENIPLTTLANLQKKLKAKAKDSSKLSPSESRLLKRVTLAIFLKSSKK